MIWEVPPEILPATTLAVAIAVLLRMTDALKRMMSVHVKWAAKEVPVHAVCKTKRVERILSGRKIEARIMSLVFL